MRTAKEIALSKLGMMVQVPSGIGRRKPTGMKHLYRRSTTPTPVFRWAGKHTCGAIVSLLVGIMLVLGIHYVTQEMSRQTTVQTDTQEMSRQTTVQTDTQEPRVSSAGFYWDGPLQSMEYMMDEAPPVILKIVWSHESLAFHRRLPPQRD